MKIRTILSVTSAMAAMLCAPAFAQETSDAAAAAAPQEDTGGIAEIVVTAQKRSENLQDVPIAISAFTAEALQSKGISDVRAISNLTPNVNLDGGAPFSGSASVLSASIRGIGQDDFAFNLDPGVGVYVDGVYLARTVGANQNLLDVERIEILKGPQGTLFGRNTIGGAISIITRTPGDRFRLTGQATAGRFNRRDLAFSVDVPIADRLSASLTVSSLQHDGYQKIIPYTAAGPYTADHPGSFLSPGEGHPDRLGGQNQQTARGKLVWKAADDLTVTATADWTHEDQASTASTVLKTFTTGATNLVAAYNACVAGAPILLCTLPRSNAGTTVAQSNSLFYGDQFITSDIDTTYATGNNFSRLTSYGGSLTIDYTLPFDANLKSITGYRKLKWTAAIDADGSPIELNEPQFAEGQHQFSQELQLTGQAFDNRLDYVFGLYYFTEGGYIHDYVTFGGGLFQVDGDNQLNTKSYATYAHLNYKVTDQLRLTVGARYSIDRKRFEGFQAERNDFFYKASGCYPFDAPSSVIGGPPTLTCQQLLGFPVPGRPQQLYPAGVNRQTFRNFSPTIGVDFQPGRDMLLYAKYSRGFKDGGWTTRLTQPLPMGQAVAPEFGPEKSETFELGAKSEWLNRHLLVNLAGFYTKYSGIQLTFVPPGSNSPTFQNAGKADIWGVELETQAVFSDAFRISGAAGYTHAEYKEIDPAAAASGLTIDNKLPKTPEFKVSVSPELTLRLGNDAKLVLGADFTHTSSLFNNAVNTPLLKRPATDMLDASIRFVSPDEKYEVAVGGKNITDERYIVTGLDQQGTGAIYGTYNAPAEWYVSFRVKFD
ncbi:MAG TPA: TonB-dependent receptor [Sphingobium sp.]